MKKEYNKPEIEIVKFETMEATMNNDVLDPSMSTGGSDEEDFS